MLKDGYGHDECLALPVIMGKPLGAAQKSKKKRFGSDGFPL